MRWIRIVTVCIVLVIAAAAGGVMYLRSIDLNEHRDLIAAQVRAVTGRDLKLAGDARLAFSLAPTVVVEDVSFANAAWGSRPAMLTARRIKARIDLLSLFSGALVIRRLLLDEPRILLETDAEGRGNWVFGPEAADETRDDTVIPVVRKVFISGGRLTYRDGRSGAVHDVSIDGLTAEAVGPTRSIGVYLAGAYNGKAFSAAGTLGPLARLLADDSFPVDLGIEAASAMIAVEGEIAHPLTFAGLDLVITAHGDDVTTLGALVGWDIPALGSYRFRARLRDANDGFRIDDLEAETGAAGGERAFVRGAIDDVVALRGLDLALHVEGRDLARLGALAGIELPARGPVAFDAKLRDTGGGYAFDDVTATVAGSDLRGAFSLDLEGRRRPRIEAALESSSLDLTWLFADDGAAPADGGGETERVFSDAPLPLATLEWADATITLRGDRVVLDRIAFDRVMLELSLVDGALDLRLAEADYGEAALAGGMTIDSRPEIPVVTARIDVDGFDVGRFLRDFGSDGLVEGRADLDLDARGAGGSVRAIMAGLDGGVSLAMREGRVGSEEIDFLAADLLDAIGPGTENDGTTRFNCFVGRFDVTDGLAASRGILFDTERMTIAGDGEIDLGTETLDLILRPAPKDASLISLATPIRIRGTLAAPSIAPDSLAVARTAGIAVIGAIATGGIGLIAPFVSAGSDEENPCVAALAGMDEGAAEKPAPGPASGAEQDAEAGSGLGGLLDDVGGVFERLFDGSRPPPAPGPCTACTR
ncbi:MAG: AsmA family protein [Alphaproteobacteria bacterium]